MSKQAKAGALTGRFAGHDIEIASMRFFRGRRTDVISAHEIRDQARSAILQRRLGTADVSRDAPRSMHPVVDVRAFTARH